MMTVVAKHLLNVLVALLRKVGLDLPVQSLHADQMKLAQVAILMSNVEWMARKQLSSLEMEARGMKTLETLGVVMMLVASRKLSVRGLPRAHMNDR